MGQDYRALLEGQRAELDAEIKQIQAAIANPAASGLDAPNLQAARNRLPKLQDDLRETTRQLIGPSRTPGTAPTTREIDVPMQDGSVWTYIYKYDSASDSFLPDSSIPPQRKAQPEGARPPSDPSKWIPIHANPADPNSKIIALQDPANSSNRVTVPADSTASRPTVVDGERGQKFSWDGTSLKELIPSSPEKRQIVQGAAGAVYSWDGQTLTSVLPGQYQAKNGDTMRDVNAQGKFVTKTFQNGQWGTTNVGKSSDPDAPYEGKTRPAFRDGYNTTETYSGGDWVRTELGTKAVPDKPTQLQAPSDQANIVTMGPEGQINQQASPNYIPKTNAEINARAGQINQAMQAKRAEVTGKVKPDGSYTAEHALAEYNSWYDQNVAPQMATLQAAQNDAALEQAKTQAKMRGDAYQQALSAGTLNVNAFNAMREANPIGNPAAYSSVMNQIGGKMGLSGLGDAFTYQAENPMDTAQAAVNNALKDIHGGAAAAVGAPNPNYQGMDLNQALARDRYGPPGLPQPLPGAGPPASLPGPGPEMTPPWQRADQMFGGAPPGPGMIPPGGQPAGWVPTSSPMYVGTQPPPGAPNPWAFAPNYSFGG